MLHLSDAERTKMLNLAQSQLPVHTAETLTKGGNQALIDLNGQIYTLRITRAGKLILTK